MPKIFINRTNDTVRIGDFSCSLTEFAKIEPSVYIPDNIDEVECCEDSTQRQCVKHTDESIFGISEDLRTQLIQLALKVPEYEVSLAALRALSNLGKQYTLPEALSLKISQINAKASDLILAKYPQHTQNNMLAESIIIINSDLTALKAGTKYTLSAAEKGTLRANTTCVAYINDIRAKSNVLCDLARKCLTLESLDALDISNVKYW